MIGVSVIFLILWLANRWYFLIKNQSDEIFSWSTRNPQGESELVWSVYPINFKGLCQAEPSLLLLLIFQTYVRGIFVFWWNTQQVGVFPMGETAPTVSYLSQIDNLGWKAFPVNVSLLFPTRLEHNFEMNNYQVSVKQVPLHLPEHTHSHFCHCVPNYTLNYLSFSKEWKPVHRHNGHEVWSKYNIFYIKILLIIAKFFSIMIYCDVTVLFTRRVLETHSVQQFHPGQRVNNWAHTFRRRAL